VVLLCDQVQVIPLMNYSILLVGDEQMFCFALFADDTKGLVGMIPLCALVVDESLYLIGQFGL